MFRIALGLITVMMVIQFACTNNAVVPTPQPPYFPQVKAIISTNCLSCHSSSGDWSGRPVAFDTDEDIVALAESIKRSVADPPSPTNRHMPEGGSLSQTEITTIVDWFEAGGLASN